MIGRSIRIALAAHWRGPRVLLVAIGLALIWTLGRFTNPWDLLAYATADDELVLIVFPLYLFLLYRNLRHPGEALLAVRMGQARTWWGSHVAAAGLTAVLVTVGVTALVIVVAVTAHAWSWHWGPNVHVSMGTAVLTTPTWRIPWRWGLEALGLMTAGLWSTGVLMYVLALWWRSPWLAWIVVVLLSYLTRIAEATSAQFLLWVLPGVQFSLALHWMTPQRPVAPAWSFGYGVALLVAMTGVGVAIVEASPWDAHHGGAL